MSSFLAKLELDGEVYTVLDCEYSFEKRTDNTSKPSGETVGGEIEITIESNGKNNFIEWVLAGDKDKSGSIVFYRRDAISKLMEIKFTKAYCIKFREKFSSSGTSPMQITMTLVALYLDFNGSSGFKKNWIIS